MAIQQKIPYITSMAVVAASVKGIEAMQKTSIKTKTLQNYYKEDQEKKK